MNRNDDPFRKMPVAEAESDVRPPRPVGAPTRTPKPQRRSDRLSSAFSMIGQALAFIGEVALDTIDDLLS
jgi:hypothetical protein